MLPAAPSAAPVRHALSLFKSDLAALSDQTPQRAKFFRLSLRALPRPIPSSSRGYGSLLRPCNALRSYRPIPVAATIPIQSVASAPASTHAPKTPVLEPKSTSRPSTSAEAVDGATIPPTSSLSSPPTSRQNSASHASPASSAHPPTAPSEKTLTWNDYLSLRRIRRRFNLVGSVVCATGTSVVGVVQISELMETRLESLNLFGMDPFLVAGLGTLGCGVIGWLIGPIVGSAGFGWWYRGLRGEIERKERDLFARIKKHRVDPSNSNAANPVPDYYGEKIGSVAQYRTWLRDQRAFNKKRGQGGGMRADIL